MKTVTVVGGGTGTYVVLSCLKRYPIDLSAIVTMMDSGGSTGRLRDQLGVLPPGDLRQCMVALSEAPELWRKLFLYRFENGDLKGHNFGNIFLSALEKVSSSYDEVIEMASYVLHTKGKVIPITFEKAHVCVKYESGTVIKGEGNIDEGNSEKSRIVKAYLEPEALANPDAIDKLQSADYIVIGPGDLYTSIIPVLLVNNIQDVIKNSSAKIIYNMNLMTKSGETTNYKASDHLQDLASYLGRAPDIVIINNGEIPKHILDWYLEHDEKPVENDLDHTTFNGTIIEGDVIDRSPHEKTKSDELTRSILRHDCEKMAKILLKEIL